MLDAIANALNNIVGFFRGIYDFIVDIPKAIYNFFTTGFKLIFEGLRNLAIMLWNLIVELWNWVSDVIKSIFINPILNFIHDIVDRINRKLDGIIFILIGVPIIYKQFEDFIKEPSKKKIGWLIISPIALYILSKAIANWIRKRKYTPLAIPTFKLEKPEELKKNIAIINQKDALLEDYASIRKGLPFIVQSDLLLNDSFSYSTIKRNIAFVNAKDKLLDGDAVSFRKAPMTRLDISFTDRLVNDAYTFVAGQPSSLYLTKVDELISESTNIVSKRPILLSSDSLLSDDVNVAIGQLVTLNQIDNLFSDNQNYTLHNIGVIVYDSYVDNTYYRTDVYAYDPYIDNVYYRTDVYAYDQYVDNTYYRTDVYAYDSYIDNAGSFFNYIKLTISDNMLFDAIDISVQAVRYPINISLTDSLLNDKGPEFSIITQPGAYPVNMLFSDYLLIDSGANIYATSQAGGNQINVSFSDSLLVDQGQSILTRSMRNLSFTDALVIDMGVGLTTITAVRVSQSDSAVSDNVNITLEPRGAT